MHHGVRVRVFFRRSSEHHSRNDSSSGTSWGHDVHVFFLIFVLVNFLRVLYNNIHHVDQRSKLHTYSAEVPVLHTPVEVRFSMTCRFVHGMGKANEGMYIYRRSCRSLSLMLSSWTVSFRCVVYSRGNRTPESEKKQTQLDQKIKITRILLQPLHLFFQHASRLNSSAVNNHNRSIAV